MASNDFMDYLNKLPKPWKFLAPMVGNSKEPYRILARIYGADVCYTEMVNSKVFNRNNCSPVINQWYTTSKADKPLVIQICGNDPQTMLQTCLSIQDYCDAIDINFGCPQEVAKKGHYGSYLQDDWNLIKEIVKVCSSGIKVPLFCKIRIFESVEKTVEYAKIFESSGASLLAIHGRTREQKGENTGLASWKHIKAVKDALKIPIVANGNLIYHENIDSCFKYSGCDGVMIGEPHLFNPCIFLPNSLQSIDVFKQFLSILDDFQGDFYANNSYIPGIKPCISLGSVKSHAFKIFNSIFKNYPEYRILLDKSENLSDYHKFLERIYNDLEQKILTVDDLKMLPYIRNNYDKSKASSDIPES